MRVCLIHRRILFKGGLESRLFNYINYFVKRGDEVTVIGAKVGADVRLPDDVKIIHADTSSTIKFFRPYVFDKLVGSILSKHQFDFTLSLERTAHQDFLIAPNTHRGYLLAKKHGC